MFYLEGSLQCYVLNTVDGTIFYIVLVPLGSEGGLRCISPQISEPGDSWNLLRTYKNVATPSLRLL